MPKQAPAQARQGCARVSIVYMYVENSCCSRRSEGCGSVVADLCRPKCAPVSGSNLLDESSARWRLAFSLIACMSMYL